MILKSKVNQCSKNEQKVSGLQEIDSKIRNALWNKILVQKFNIVEIYVHGRDRPVLAELLVSGCRDSWNIIARFRTFRLSWFGWRINMNGLHFGGYSANVLPTSDSDGRSQASSRCGLKNDYRNEKNCTFVNFGTVNNLLKGENQKILNRILFYTGCIFDWDQDGKSQAGSWWGISFLRSMELKNYYTIGTLRTFRIQMKN